MFVVSPASRTLKPGTEKAPEFDIFFPVVWENTAHGYAGEQVANRPTRETAQALADALNAVLAPSSKG